MLMCTFGGFIHVNYYSNSNETESKQDTENVFNYILKSPNLLIVGSLRYTTLFLGLIALWYVEVSFAETGNFNLIFLLHK